jgi:hypothetical protein
MYAYALVGKRLENYVILIDMDVVIAGCFFGRLGMAGST